MTMLPQLAEHAPSAHPAPARHLGLLLTSAVLLASFAYCYADVFGALWRQWNTNEANSHGFLIPWIAVYLVWVERQRLLSLTVRPAWWAGLPLLLVSIGVLLLGRLAGIIGLQEVSMVGTLWGMALLILGWSGLRAVWFPAAYLLFMMPIWDLATEPMYRPLQLFAAWGTEVTLSAVGIPVFRQGTILQLPNTAVEVAFACSGINFLMSVVAIGTVLAYLLTRSAARRLVILAVAAGIALLANPARVTVIVYSFYTGLASPQQSHMWQGMLVSLGAFAVLFFAARRIAGPAGEAAVTPATSSVPAASSARVVALACLCCLILIGGGMSRPLEWRTPSLDSLVLESVPYELGEWRAIPGERPAPPPSGVVMPDELWREYRRPGGGSVRVYVGRFVHDLGSGNLRYWSEEFDHVSTARGAGRERLAALNAAVVGRRGDATAVVYWYQLDKAVSTSRAVAKLYSLWGAAIGGPGSVAAVVFAGQAGGATQETTSELTQFAKRFADALNASREP